MTKAELEDVVRAETATVFLEMQSQAICSAFMFHFEIKVRAAVAAKVAVRHWLKFNWDHDAQTIHVECDVIPPSERMRELLAI